MRIVFDTETHLIKPGMIMPRLVCVSYAIGEEKVGLMDRPTSLVRMREWLVDSSNEFVGHHIQYDWGVLAAEDVTLLPLIFKAYQEGRVHDTKIRQQLVDIAHGDLKFHDAEDGEEEAEEGKQIQFILKTQYSLEALAWRLCKIKVAKENTYRLKYATLDGIPIERWPQEAVDYALGDAIATRDVFQEQKKRYETKVFVNSAKQHQAAWALQLMSAWGVRTDGDAVADLRKRLEEELKIAYGKLAGTGILREGSTQRNMEVIRDKVVAGYAQKKLEVPKTEKGAVSTAGEILLASGDTDLKVLADAMKSMKLISTYVPILESGTRYPINASFNVLVETGRTSCSRPNLQNPPRKGGVRECFVPRDGFVLGTVDYDTLELRTLAQATIAMKCERRAMADALCKGEDLHLNLAADVLGLDRDEAKARYKAGDKIVDEYRQLCKIANFGYPGGMSAKTFVEYAAGYGVKITQEKSDELHRAWKSAWPEMNEYFKRVKIALDDPEVEVPTICHHYSHRYRGKVTFTAASNSYFQGLAADGAKDAMWEVTKECFDRSSPLFGSHPVVFMHDEIMTEIPFDLANPSLTSNAIKRQAEIMISVMKKWVPDIPITATPVLMRRWFKGAKPVYDEYNNLLPSKPVTEGNKIKWIPDLDTNLTVKPSAPTADILKTNISIAASASL